ncbi:MAG: hypothetical protein DMF86_08075 [Acidobacteria bacterium]|nr:MAG: hypothetical protein DMF86_08075 [Acidobacteriota bacterium]
MTKPSVRSYLVPVLTCAILTAPWTTAQAGQRPQSPARGGVPASPGRAADEGVRGSAVADDRDANETRERFKETLERYPPSLARVLKLDPSLLTNQDYLASYPGVATFVAQHPEVAHNPGYFLEWVRSQGDWGAPQTPRDQLLNFWKDLLAGTALFVGLTMLAWFVSWLIRMFVDHRRWLRLSKIQTEAHTKLLDRFTANEDLLNYIQSPAGRRFLESAPIVTDAAPRGVGAPYGRMLWSMQAGVVLAVTGIGLEIISARSGEEFAPPLAGFGVLAMALGVGFVLSAIIAYILSRRLGLIEPPAPATDSRG